MALGFAVFCVWAAGESETASTPATARADIHLTNLLTTLLFALRPPKAQRQLSALILFISRTRIRGSVILVIR